MKNKKWIFLLFSLALVISCNEKECIIIRENNVAGKIIKNRINECENNRVISEQEFAKNGRDLIPDGFYKDYYSNGKLKSIGFFKNGNQDSLAIQYYENGNTKIRNYKSDKHFSGPQYYFSEEGKVESIEFYNENSKVWLNVRYNHHEKIDCIEGKMVNIMPDKRKFFHDSLPVGEVLPLIIEVPFVYKARTLLNLSLKKSGVVVHDTTVSDFISVYNIRVYPYGERLMKNGVYEYIASVSFVDSLSGALIKKDSSIFRVNVGNMDNR